MSLKPPRPKLPALNALRAFEAAARAESFTAAAAELGVTPGAIAQQVRRLEAWVGAPLFHRAAQGVTLTDAAREALPRLAQGFDALGAAARDLRDAHRPRALSICALPCIAQIWLSTRLRRMRRAFPGVEMSLTARETPPDFRREPYDLALFYLADVPEGATATTLREDELFPVCAPELLAAGPPLSSPDDLANHTLLHDAVWRSDWRRWLDVAGADHVDAARGPSFSLYSLALDAALDGEGVLMGRRSLVADALANGRLTAPFATVLPAADPLVVLTPRAPQSGVAADIVAWLRTHA